MKKNVMRKCGWMAAVAAVCLLPCVAVAAVATPLGVLDPEDATAYLTAGAQIFKGDLVKQGNGTTTLSLADVHTAGGRIVVADGTLAVSGATAANDPGKPWGVLSNAVVWLDASMPETIGFVEGSSVNVSEWRDVRETGTGSASSPYLYRRAVAYTNIGHSATYAPDPAGWFPEYVPANGGENAYVDFGQYSSGRMVRFLDISGNVSAISNMRHAFVVLGTHDGHYGFLFNPGSGNVIFVPQSYGNLVNCTPGKFIQQAAGWSVLLTGVFRVDGKAVDPVNEAGPNGGYQLLDIAAGKDGWNPVGLFSHDTIASQANGYRQGGGRLCEAILFDKPLEERDRLKIEAYLRWKWFGAEVAAPTCFVNKDATLAIDNSGGGVQRSDGYRQRSGNARSRNA